MAQNPPPQQFQPPPQNLPQQFHPPQYNIPQMQPNSAYPQEVVMPQIPPKIEIAMSQPPIQRSLFTTPHETQPYTGSRDGPTEFAGTFENKEFNVSDDLQENKPTCPVILFTNPEQTKCALPLKSIRIDTEFHIGTMFGNMKLLFFNNTLNDVSGVFAFPIEGTVTNVEIKINSKKPRFVKTTYVSGEDAEKHLSSTVGQDPNDLYIPDLFRVPVSKIPSQVGVEVQISWMAPVEVVNGGYNYHIPLHFPRYLLPDFSQVFIQARVNCLIPGIQYYSSSHQLQIKLNENLRTGLICSPKSEGSHYPDFHLCYTVASKEISAACLIEPPVENSYDKCGSYVVFANPPVESQPFRRDIIFLVDRSGSMNGRPLRDAQAALCTALQNLNPGDRFGIVAFDHEPMFFLGEPYPGAECCMVPTSSALFDRTPELIHNACTFVNNIACRGATDISTPLQWATEELKRNHRSLSFVILITDGAVENEKVICQKVKETSGPVRILTFGIGTHCNWYFLKVLGLESRGWNTGALNPETLQAKMHALIDRASKPVLSNVELHAAGVELEQYPKKIPDMFVGGPLVIAGKYTGTFPPNVVLTGQLCDGSNFKMEVRSDTSKVVPVGKVFVKQQLDQLIALEWLTEDQALREKIIQLSLNEELPTPYTKMISYELSQKQKDKLEAEEEKNRKNGTMNKKGPNAKMIAKYAAGSVAVAAGLVLVGSIAASALNAGAFAGLAESGAIFEGIGDVDLDCCGECECGEFLECFSCFESCECGEIDLECCGDCDITGIFESCGDSCGDALEGIQSCLETIGGLFG